MVERLLAAIRDFYRAEVERGSLGGAAVGGAGRMIGEVVDALESVDPPADVEPDLRPVVRHLRDVTADSGHERADAIVAALIGAAESLPWTQTAGYRSVLSQEYLDNYGYVRLLGPGAVIEHATVTVGVGLWGPGLYYPLHEHPAEELYHVLHGRPAFRTDMTEFVVRKVGEAIHHEPWVRHAQQFGAEPTLLLYAWVGDITTDARIVEAV